MLSVKNFASNPVYFGEWLRTFSPIEKSNNQWVLESQIPTQVLYNVFEKHINELNEALESATNVKSITWSVEKSSWHIQYLNNLPEDFVTTELVIDFLYNA